MASYDNKNFNAMREEAIQRVREMHKRAQKMIDETDFIEIEKNVKPPVPPPKIEEKKTSAKTSNKQNSYSEKNKNLNAFSQIFGSNLGGFEQFKNKNSNNKFSQIPPSASIDSLKGLTSGLFDGVFKNFNIDEEKIIIGVLIYLLYKNGGDIKLLLALGYLLI